MKILWDECVPWPLARLMSFHECVTTQQMGWAGIKNGALLDLAEGRYDIFLTSDQNLRYQQNLSGRQIAVLELSTNDLRRLREAVAAILQAVSDLQPGEVRRLEIS